MTSLHKLLNRGLILSLIATGAAYGGTSSDTKPTEEKKGWMDSIKEYGTQGWKLFKENALTDSGSFDANHLAGVLCGSTLTRYPVTSLVLAAGLTFGMPIIEDLIYAQQKLNKLVKELTEANKKTEETEENEENEENKENKENKDITKILKRAAADYKQSDEDKKNKKNAPITTFKELIEQINKVEKCSENIKNVITNFEDKEKARPNLKQRAARLAAGSGVGLIGNLAISFIGTALGA